MGSLTFSAGVSVKDKLPFKNRFEDIHYCVVDYPVGERIFWNSQWITGANSFNRMFEEWGRFLISSFVIAGFCTIAARCSSVARPARQSIFWRTYKKRLMWLLEVPEQEVISRTLPTFAGICFWEALRMTCECVIALVTCVATIITTVIAVLSYLHDRKE